MQVFADRAYGQACLDFRRPPDRALGQYMQALDALLKQTRGRQPTIVDVGCGPGTLTVPLARLAASHGGEVIALDSSSEMLKLLERWVATEGVGEIVTVQQGDFLSYRPPAPCSLVWASNVVHLIPDLDAFSESADAVLRAGGAVAIRMASHAQLRSYEWGDFFPEALEIDLERHHDIGAVCASLGRRGFREVAVLEIDETRVWPTARYLSAFEQRYISCLRLMDERRFASGLRRMRRACEGRPRTLRNARKTLITARAAGGVG